MSSVPAYPRRNGHFAHKFVRLMGKVCLGNEIGPEACWLLSYIAHTEDAKGYRAPVTFFNDDLATRLGMSLAAMKRARDKAVAAGWLSHQHGAKGRAARYFVTVPAEYLGIDDAAGDESGDDFPAQSEPTSGRQAADKRTESEPDDTCRLNLSRQADGKRTESEPHSSLSLSQDRQDSPSDVGQNDEPFDPLKAEDAAKKEFVRRWNDAGLRPLERFPSTLISWLRAAMQNDDWRKSYPQALARAGEIPFLASGDGRTKGPLDIAEFLRDLDLGRQILAGVYDPRGTGPPSRRGVDVGVSKPGLNYESAVKLGFL